MQNLFTKKFLIILAILIAGFFIITYYLQFQLITAYNNQQSSVLIDRNDKIISILPNSKGYYAQYTKSLPKNLRQLLIKKEDRFFYYHPGFNPISIIRAGLSKLGLGKRDGASTITQQLTKNLLGNELDRSIKNKALETLYAISLETYHSKEEILKMSKKEIDVISSPISISDEMSTSGEDISSFYNEKISENPDISGIIFFTEFSKNLNIFSEGNVPKIALFCPHINPEIISLMKENIIQVAIVSSPEPKVRKKGEIIPPEELFKKSFIIINPENLEEILKKYQKIVKK